jgi:hypothetical protein
MTAYTVHKLSCKQNVNSANCTKFNWPKLYKLSPLSWYGITTDGMPSQGHTVNPLHDWGDTTISRGVNNILFSGNRAHRSNIFC